MVAYDTRAKAQASRMLATIVGGGKGQAVTLTVPATNGTFNPSTDTTTGASAPGTHTGSGVEIAYDARSIDGTVIQNGDVKFLLSPLKADGSAIPQPVADRDTLTKGGKVWAIKAVETLAPAGTAIMFTLQLRGA